MARAKGYIISEATREKMRLAHLGKKTALGCKHSEESKEKMRLRFKGEKSPLWKGGITNDRKYLSGYLKKWRHSKGINKKYITNTIKSDTIEYRKLARKKYKYNFRNAGVLTSETITKVYQDNINKFGILSCYLCGQPIGESKEHLEHKTPLSRGGTNEYDNLGIACQKCNYQKRNKTLDEYTQWINIYRRTA